MNFVISARNINGEWDYYNIDSRSGGYPFWSPYGAAKFASVESAERRIAADKQCNVWKYMLDGKHDFSTLAVRKIAYITAKKLNI